MNFHIQKYLIILVVLFLSLASLAQDKGIPTNYMNDPAVDLVYKEKVLLPEQAHALREKYKGHFDLSTLNPIQTSDLWKDAYSAKLSEDQNPLENFDEVSYHSPVLSPSGIFRFNIQNSGDGKLYTMMLSKTVHSILLAKGLLRKIGYQIPDIKYLPKVIVSFSDELQKKSFISYLENVALAGFSKNWVLDEFDGNKLLLQDLVVMESNHPIYNLALGVTSEMIQGRRLLSSLAVPLTIVNLSESVNMLRWNAGIRNANNIVLFHNNLDQFMCGWDDARWISRRIEKLTRNDWIEIVAQSHVPKAVGQLLVEKLISRRNSVMKLFKIDHNEIKVDGEVSNGVELVKGKLTQQQWPGYASRFSYGDPESPLAASEMRSFFKSKAISTVLDLAVAQINQLPFLGTDIKKINQENFQKRIESAISQSIETQTPFEVPLKSWVFPTFRGNLILSRNIVTGTYLGTDNLVQLVDTFGVSLEAGVFLGTMGLPTPLKAFAQAQAQFVRTYAHLRPVTSLKKSLKYPFKNIIIPLVKKDYGNKLHEATVVSLDPEISEKVKIDLILEALKPFKEAMDIGESILVTDAIATGVGGRVEAGYKKLLTASLNLFPGYNVISRFHVHRRSEHDFQIYKDVGNVGNLSFGLELDSLVPVLNVNFKKSKGKAKVKFYRLNLNPKNPTVLKEASVLRRAILNSSVSDLDQDSKYSPYVLNHAFKETNPKVNLFFWQWQGQRSSTQFEIENPSGDKRFFRRQYQGLTKGKNYQKYVNSLITHWVSLLFDRQAGLSEGGDNPGYSFKGIAQTRYLTLDEEVTDSGNKIEPFARLTRVYNGWSITQKKAERILEELKNRYRFDFFNAPVLNDTRRIFLYNISLNIFFYKNGLDHMLGLSDDEVKEAFRKNASFGNLIVNLAKVSDDDTGVFKFLRFLKRFRFYEKKNDFKKANKYLLKALSQAEHKLTLSGLVSLMGGEGNIFVNSRIDGFREADEDGDREILSNSLGEFGSRNRLGPLVELQRNTDMLEGEFFIYWLMKRLI